MKKTKLVTGIFLASASCFTSFAAIDYDNSSQPGDLIVTVTGSQTEETFDAEQLVEGVTNIVKRGTGTLSGVDLSSYTGMFTVEKGSYQGKVEYGLGSKTKPGHVRVLSGASVELNTFSALSPIPNAFTFGTPGSEDPGRLYCSAQPNKCEDLTGKVVLDNHLRCYCYFNDPILQFQGPVSGIGGIYVHGQDSFDRNGDRIRYNPRLRLLNPLNSFSGGLWGTYCTVELHADGALPASGGMLALTNSFLKLTGDGAYSLPDAVFSSTGTVSVTGGYGNWKNTMVKDGPGALEYGSHVGADTLELRGGGIRLPSVSYSSIAGLHKGTNWCESAKAAQNLLENSRETFTNSVSLSTDMANVYTSKLLTLPPEDCYGWRTNMVVTYTGYIWNRTGTNAVWTFASNMIAGDRIRLYVNDVDTGLYGKDSTIVRTNVTVNPGPNAFEVRLRSSSDKYAGCRDDIVNNKNKLWETKMGFAVDFQGRMSTNAADYVRAEDPGDGSFLTTEAPTLQEMAAMSDDLEDSETFRIGTLKASPGTWIEFSTDTLLFAVGNLEGMPAVTNVISRPFAVTDSWKVSMDEVPENALSVTGELVFGEGSTLSLENAVLFRSAAGGKTEYVIARAEGGITGMPVLEAPANYSLVKSDDGRELTLVRRPKGLKIIVR